MIDFGFGASALVLRHALGDSPSPSALLAKADQDSVRHSENVSLRHEEGELNRRGNLTRYNLLTSREGKLTGRYCVLTKLRSAVQGVCVCVSVCVSVCVCVCVCVCV